MAGTHRMWMQHTTLQQIKEWWRVVVNDYFTFTFVRNPYDRAVSDWLWFKNDVGKGQSPDDPRLQYDFTESTLMDYLLNENSFERLENFDLDNRNYGYYWSDHSLLQYQYICDSDGNVPVQFIGRFENLEQDWMQLMNILTEKYKVTFNHELPHVNKTRSKKWEKSHYSEYYDDETREIATDRYSIDLELLNYTFEDITS